MTTNLPTPIALYITAENSGDAEAFSRCFAENAVVRDEAQTIQGLGAIKQWKAETSKKYQHTIEPLSSVQKDGKTIVTNRLIGNFPGSPIELEFVFTLDGDKIVSLEILSLSDNLKLNVAGDTTRSAHRAPNGSFRNPWPDSELAGWRDVLRMLRERQTQGRAETPARGTFPTVAPAIAYPRASESEFAATWIGHSSVLLQFGGLNVLTDPVFSERASPVQWLGPRRIMDPALPIDALPPLDVVLVSHNHYDHLDKAAVKWIARAHPHTTWIVPLGVGAYIQDWGPRDIVELDWWQQTVSNSLRVTATPARHFSGRWLRDRNKSLWCGFAFEIEGRRSFFAGDTAYHPEFGEIGARCGPFDFVMIPIGAYDPRWFMHVVHVGPEEAVQIYQDLVASHPGVPLPLMLGMHWGTFRLTDEPMDEPPRRTAARWEAAGRDADRLWIARFGETRAVSR